MLHQRTIASSIETSGVGLHSGKKVQMTLRPALENSGIRFRRMDTDPIQEVHAIADNVTDTNLGTTISENETSIMTVEHLLSALAGLGIDNVYIDLHGPEIPIMDGSAASFILLIESAGIQEQSAAKKFLRIKKNIFIIIIPTIIFVSPQILISLQSL